MKKLVLVPAIVAASVAVQLPAQAATVQELEERLIKLEKNDRRAKFRIRSMKKAMSEADEKFRVNGFFSAGMSTFKTSNNSGFLSTQNFDGKVTNKVTAEPESHVGLQFTGKVNDKADFVTQIVARGGNDFDAAVEWAFLKYQLNDDITLRAGRLRTPFFQLSEYLEVQYAMPWVRGPQEVYGASISSYTGADALYRKRLGAANFAAQVYYGSDDSVGANGAVRLKLDQLHGIRLSAEYKGFTAGISYSRANATFSDFSEGSVVQNAETLRGNIETLAKDALGLTQIALNNPSTAPLASDLSPSRLTEYIGLISQPYEGNPAAIVDGEASFANVFLGYSNGPLDIKAEAIRQKVEGTFQDEDGQYLSVAYRIGDFTPYVYAAKIYTIDDENRAKAVAQLNSWQQTFESDVKKAIKLGQTLKNASTTEKKRTDDGLQEISDGLKTLKGSVAGFTGEHSSYALGVRWDFISNLALKLEYQKFYDVVNSPRIYPDKLSNPELEPQGEMELYTITINGVF